MSLFGRKRKPEPLPDPDQPVFFVPLWTKSAWARSSIHGEIPVVRIPEDEILPSNEEQGE